MKIYFDGCSWTCGEELENREEQRYSKLIANDLGAKLDNFSTSGASNDRMVRNLMVENDIEKYDLAIIQMTFPARTEYYSGVEYDKDVHPSGWINVNPKYKFSYFLHLRKAIGVKWADMSTKDSLSKEEEHEVFKNLQEKFHYDKRFWKEYYKVVTTEKFFNTKENIHKQTIENYCQIKGVPLILCSINAWTKLRFDYMMNTTHPSKRKDDGKPILDGSLVHRYGHPTKDGHRMIADHILGIIETMNKLK